MFYVLIRRPNRIANVSQLIAEVHLKISIRIHLCHVAARHNCLITNSKSILFRRIQQQRNSDLVLHNVLFACTSGNLILDSRIY